LNSPRPRLRLASLRRSSPLPLGHDHDHDAQRGAIRNSLTIISETTALTFCFAFSQYRATVNQECITAFNDLKLNKKYKYIVYKLSDDYKEIVVEHASENRDWEDFREKLINATSKSRSVRMPT
jgi:hypothetical protein